MNFRWNRRLQIDLGSYQFIRCCLSLVLLASCGAICTADEEQVSEIGSRGKPANLADILSQQTRATFDAVSMYIDENPDATDVHQSYNWLFDAAQQYGYEAEALPLAEAYLKREMTDEKTSVRARQLRILGLAANGKLDDALQSFEQEMRNVNVRSPNSAVEFALAVSSQAQLANDSDAAQRVIQRLSRAFLINPYVRTLCENRLYRLELSDRPAPRLGGTDFDGKPVELSDYEGKVLLVDFWATNCAPCLAEFPAMKQLYADYHDKGLEIVGISLDDQRETVDQFQERWKLPWRMSMSSSDSGATRTRYHARTIPSMFLIDQKGRVVRIDVRGHNLRRSVAQLLPVDK